MSKDNDTISQKTYTHEEYLRKFLPYEYSTQLVEESTAEEFGIELDNMALSKIKDEMSKTSKKIKPK